MNEAKLSVAGCCESSLAEGRADLIDIALIDIALIDIALN
jgi:hypothetical protein